MYLIIKYNSPKLLKINLSVPILINNIHNLLPHLFTQLNPRRKHLLQLLLRNTSTPILIKHIKRHLQILLRHKLSNIHSRHYKFRKIDIPISINIHMLHNTIRGLLCLLVSHKLTVLFNQFLFTKLPISISIHSDKSIF